MTTPIQSKRWWVWPKINAQADHNLHRFPPILRQILFNRGLTNYEAAKLFLEARPPEDSEPQKMLGILAAVDRIRSAIRGNELIAVYGDYDADGVTATALLTQALQTCGGRVRGYIPNRFDEGYGVNIDALTTLKDEGVGLVITVDCGIRSLPEAEYAQEIGLDMIISDHHHPGQNMPPALAVINPKQPGDTYTYKDLAGVGLAFKLASALFETVGCQADIRAYLDLVALGTVADLAPLTGENRALVRLGLRTIQKSQRQGLLSLIGVAGLKAESINATDIGFGLGPRLNAAGRLDSALASLDLLLTQDLFEAGRLAQQLEVQNQERQKITREIQARAEQIALADHPDTLLLFAAHSDFNSGVVGLAASRLTEQYYRPAIVGWRGEEFTRASCRSIPEFHITQALDSCADLLEHYGGHAAAAGFTVRNENLDELIERLQASASEHLGDLDLRPTVRADIEIPLSDLKPELLQHLSWLQPTGTGNPQAIFISRGLHISRARPVGRDNAHLKLTVTDGRITYDAIAFRLGHWYEQLPGEVDLVYTFETNEYNGRTSLQLNVRDLKPTGASE